MRFRTTSALAATVALTLGASQLLVACGDEHDKNIIGTPKSLDDLTTESRGSAEQILFIYEGQDDTVEQDSLVDSASCTATRTKLWGEREKLKLGESYGNLRNTPVHTRFGQNMDAYNKLGCKPDTHVLECDDLRKKLVQDLKKVISTQEFSVLRKRDDYQSVAKGYSDAVKDECIQAKNI